MKSSSLLTENGTEVSSYPQRPQSIEQVCEWGGFSRRFLELEIARGRLKVRRLSKRLIRILPKDIIEWMEASTELV
jgi:hypothetical protein